MTVIADDVPFPPPPPPTPPAPPSLRAALAELSLAGAIVLSEIETTELRDTWKKKPNTARLLAALELAREALSQ